MRTPIFLLSSLAALFSLSLAEFCSRMQACEAQISRYPHSEDVGLQLAQHTRAQEASGWGSGMIPLYDELLDEQNPLDYTQEPELATHSLCTCINNQTCDSSVDSRNMNLDNSLRLTFCADVDSQLVNACKGRRGLIRVIGPADETGSFVDSVSSTIVFCSCPTGYQRQQTEVWEGGLLSVQYKCV